MPGFVDVSNMSDLEIKRLGQIDEVDPRDNPYAYRNLARRNPYGYRKPMNRTPKVTFSHNTDDVWAAAVQAYNINGRYIKTLSDVAEGVIIDGTNRQIVDKLLADTMQITQESRDKALAMRQYFKALTFKLIEGKTLSPFLQSAMEFANQEQITNNLGIGIIASLPATYEKMVARDDTDRKIKWARGGFLGSIGDKVTADIEVVKQIWSQNWNTYYITGITSDDKVLFFSYKSNIEIGDRVTIQGTVKAHCTSSTQLNRVKVIK